MARQAILRGEERPEDQLFKTLRPRRLDEFIGQNKIKEQLKIYLKAAEERGDILDHILLHGPPGLGKCITGDSLILTGCGWVEFRELIPPNLAVDSFIPHEELVYGLHGWEPTSHIYASGRRMTLRLKTQAGFVLEGTPNHAVLSASANGLEWKRLNQLTPKDYVAIRRGLNVWGQSKRLDFQPRLESNPVRRPSLHQRIKWLHALLAEQLRRHPTAVELKAAHGNAAAFSAAKRLELSNGRVVRSVQIPPQPRHAISASSGCRLSLPHGADGGRRAF